MSRLILRHPDGWMVFPPKPRRRRKPCDQEWRYWAALILSVLWVIAAARVFPPIALIPG